MTPTPLERLDEISRQLAECRIESADGFDSLAASINRLELAVALLSGILDQRDLRKRPTGYEPPDQLARTLPFRLPPR